MKASAADECGRPKRSGSAPKCNKHAPCDTQRGGLRSRRTIWLALAGAAAGLVACGPTGAFECRTDGDCVQSTLGDGVCQPTGYCSFPDGACDSGQRYGDLSDQYAGECVPEGETDTEADDDDGGLSAGETSGISAGSWSTSEASTGSTSGAGTTGQDSGNTEPGTTAETDDPGSESSGSSIDADLALWLTFDGSPDTDESAYEHAVECSMSCPDAVDGQFGSAVDFTNEALRVPYHPSLDLSGSFTLSLWARADGPQALGRGTLISQVYDAEMAFDLSIQDLDGDSTYDLVSAIEGVGGASLDAFPVGDWVHVAVLYTPGQQEVFVNGASAIGQATPMASSPGTDLYLGAIPGGLSFQLTGAIDDVRLYRRILSEADLASVMSGATVK